MAEQIKRDILSGVYKFGDRIPPESAIRKESGLALLTVRQALGVLVEEGLLEKIPRRGTYVKELSWHGATFNIDGLVHKISREDTRVRIIKAEVKKATEAVAAGLKLAAGSSVIYLKRTISSGEGPFLVQEGHLRLDPFRPVMEAELEATYLNGLFTGGGHGLITRANLVIDPVILSEEDTRLLNCPTGPMAGFRLSYIFFDAQAAPLAVGDFFTPAGGLRLSSSIGILGRPAAREGEDL